MLRKRIVTHPAVKAAFPVGSPRRAAVAKVFKKVWPGPPPKAKPAPSQTLDPAAKKARSEEAKRKKIRAEEAKLQGIWVKYKPDTLGHYLVSGYQDPRINAQSILARHTLVRELFGSEFDSLMREEFAWAVELNNEVRLKAAELGVKIKTTTNAARQAEIEQVVAVIADRVDEFSKRWHDALADRKAPKISILEYACGSANDYRSFAAYGIAPFLDYTGVDLNPTNIANAREMFPDVNFRVGSVMSLPEADRSVDFVIGFDIMEHLSLVGSEEATASALRICRKGVYFAYFLMDEIPENIERPVRDYHRNWLSAPKVRKLMGEHFNDVQLIKISDMLRDDYGYAHSHTKAAYTLIAQNPR